MTKVDLFHNLRVKFNELSLREHLIVEETTKELEQENEQLKAQIEKMRNCKNCKNYKVEGICGGFTQVGFCKNWEMQE